MSHVIIEFEEPASRASTWVTIQGGGKECSHEVGAEAYRRAQAEGTASLLTLAAEDGGSTWHSLIKNAVAKRLTVSVNGEVADIEDVKRAFGMMGQLHAR